MLKLSYLKIIVTSTKKCKKLERKIAEEGLKLEMAQTKAVEKENLLLDCVTCESNIVKAMEDLNKELILENC